MPITGFLVSSLTPAKYKISVIVTSFTVPIIIFLVYIILDLHKEINKKEENIRIYKSVYQVISNEKLILDEYHHINLLKTIWKITGSDASLESRIQGINVHPEGKKSKQMNFLLSFDAENYRFAFRAHNNITNKDIDLDAERSQFISKNTMHSILHFQPIEIGDPIDFTIKRFGAGAISKRHEYLCSYFSNFLRGVDYLHGIILFDRKPASYSSTTITPSGDIQEIEINLKGKLINQHDSCYQLEWKVPNPQTMIIINFIFPRLDSY